MFWRHAWLFEQFWKLNIYFLYWWWIWVVPVILKVFGPMEVEQGFSPTFFDGSPENFKKSWNMIECRIKIPVGHGQPISWVVSRNSNPSLTFTIFQIQIIMWHFLKLDGKIFKNEVLICRTVNILNYQIVFFW